VDWAARSSSDALTGVVERLKGYLPAMRQAALAPRRRPRAGPADEKSAQMAHGFRLFSA